MTTMLDIANAVGVAKSTVSRALREDPTLSIGEETRRKIFSVAKEMGYKIKKEKLLSGGQSIVVVHKDTHFLNQLDNSYYFSVRYGIESACLALGLQCSFLPYSFLHNMPLHIDGVIVMGNFEREQMEKIERAARHLPMSFIGKINHLPHRIDWITYDVKACVDIALSHLVETKHKSVLYVGGHDVPGTPKEYQKIYHFRQFLESNAALTCMDVLEGEHGAESGYQMMHTWLQGNPALPDAVFVSNDPIAFGVLRALAEKDIPIPAQISVIGINGDGPGASCAPPLTTVNIHTAAMGEEAVYCLCDQLSKKRSLIKKISFAPDLNERNSVATQ